MSLYTRVLYLLHNKIQFSPVLDEDDMIKALQSYVYGVYNSVIFNDLFLQEAITYGNHSSTAWCGEAVALYSMV